MPVELHMGVNAFSPRWGCLGGVSWGLGVCSLPPTPGPWEGGCLNAGEKKVGVSPGQGRLCSALAEGALGPRHSH